MPPENSTPPVCELCSLITRGDFVSIACCVFLCDTATWEGTHWQLAADGSHVSISLRPVSAIEQVESCGIWTGLYLLDRVPAGSIHMYRNALGRCYFPALWEVQTPGRPFPMTSQQTQTHASPCVRGLVGVEWEVGQQSVDSQDWSDPDRCSQILQMPSPVVCVSVEVLIQSIKGWMEIGGLSATWSVLCHFTVFQVTFYRNCVNICIDCSHHWLFYVYTTTSLLFICVYPFIVSRLYHNDDFMKEPSLCVIKCIWGHWLWTSITLWPCQPFV